MEKIYSNQHKCKRSKLLCKMCGMAVNYESAEYFMNFVFCSKRCRILFENLLEKTNVKDLFEREIVI
ncbi:MAG: hypothetical protein HYW26_05425 [Candidatus Aenigmarchaeota archaeon]|nr:hypothetical protein [Candidatus Aenigmarchaeota archaeon]